MAEFVVAVEAKVWFDAFVEADNYEEAYKLATEKLVFSDFVVDEDSVDYTNRVYVFDADGNDVEFFDGVRKGA